MKKLAIALSAAAVAALLSGCAYDNGYGYGYGSRYDYGYRDRYDNDGYDNRGYDCRRNYDRRYCYDYRR